MSKYYILFSEEELSDLGKGNEIEHQMLSGETVYFMCAERYAEMVAEKAACEECNRKCAQFMCCMCDNKDTCECSKIEPPEDE